MTAESADILSAALTLSDAERLRIAESLFASVAPSYIMSVDDPASIAELQRRLCTPKEELIEHDEAMRRVRQTLATRQTERGQG